MMDRPELTWDGRGRWLYAPLINNEGERGLYAVTQRGRRILIAPPSEEELRRRLAGRGSETDETLQRRLEKANAEVAAAQASGVYTHYVINDELQTAIREVVALITPETSRT